MRQTVTACLIVLDEAERLPGALASLSFCDELVVVDSGSTDGSIAIATTAGARVIENPWPGFAAQRNVALRNATSDWVLELDADERISDALRDEILEFLAAPPSDADIAALPIRHMFLRGRLGPSAKYPDYRYRLFRRGAYEHDEQRVVHEGLWSNGRAHAMHGDLEHLLAESWSEAFADAVHYARLEGLQAPVPRGLLGFARAFVLRPLAKVGFRVTAHAGWRDGWRGLTKIVLDAATDVLVAVHAVRSARVPRPLGSSDGRPDRSSGSARLIAIASDDAAPEAIAWLERAAERGADTSLVTSGDHRSSRVRVARVDRFSPLAVLRAVDSENQLRPCDFLVTAGRTAERVAWVLPRALTGDRRPISTRIDPIEVVIATERRVRA